MLSKIVTIACSDPFFVDLVGLDFFHFPVSPDHHSFILLYDAVAIFTLLYAQYKTKCHFSPSAEISHSQPKSSVHSPTFCPRDRVGSFQ